MKIELKNITKTINSRIILNNLTYSFDEKGLYIIKGKNGAGKTTLLYILSLIDTFYDGKYLINDKNVKELSKKELKHIKMNNISLLFSKGNLISYLNVKENLMINNKGASLNNLNINLKQDVTTLSGGEEIRVSLINELNDNKEILLLDEVTSSLDDSNFILLMKTLENEANNRLIILVSHDPRTYEYGKLLNLEDGKLLEN